MSLTQYSLPSDGALFGRDPVWIKCIELSPKAEFTVNYAQGDESSEYKTSL